MFAEGSVFPLGPLSSEKNPLETLFEPCLYIKESPRHSLMLFDSNTGPPYHLDNI